ncbi:Abhydrolase 2 domain-containing protein [Citrus sinensis]|uniref:Abhydrolase 2 domain-containing protein n=1 Tax=Citrus sinensis TaxID=2711 RepID=A0ACB8NP78_CITSI|nr:Abhydrolase 2 domain-containing protein [Citrus sinensis]KAH9799195.1 Abhydrolase 2 domain-containing protein [Citrus sinensis]
MVINRDSENQFLFIAGTQLNIETSGFGSVIILLLIMSYSSTTMGSGSQSRRPFEFGRTHVVRPKGKHQATIVWLHGLSDKGSSWSQLLETLPLPNVRISTFASICVLMQHLSTGYPSLPIKWICPTAPTRPVAIFGGYPCTAWFDVGDLSEDGPDDLEGLDASAAHVANLLSTEPADIKLGIGGFSMGAAIALYSATCRILGQYGNGNPYSVNLSAIVGLSGWLPCSRTLKSRMEGSREATRRAASLPILLCHGSGDDVVAYKHGERSAQTLNSVGFRDLTFRCYNGVGHYTVPEEMDEVRNWLTARLELEGLRA